MRAKNYLEGGETDLGGYMACPLYLINYMYVDNDNGHGKAVFSAHLLHPVTAISTYLKHSI